MLEKRKKLGMEVDISVVLLLVGVAVLLIIHVCIVSRGFSRNYTNGTIVVQRNIVARSPSMSQDDIMKLPSFDYMVEEDKGSNPTATIPLDCAVCVENFKVGEKCRLLPKCNHSFHAECIDSWLAKTAACPICRTGANYSPSIGGGNHNLEVEVGDELV